MDPLGPKGGDGAQLVDVLLDHDARWDERDDAAMDLGGFDEREAFQALLQVGFDTSEDETLLETVGGALAEIVNRNPERDVVEIAKLAPPALRAFREGLRT